MSSPLPAGSARRLTVAVIARDAESLLARTLESVRQVADEIVVADTGSQDETRRIAASLADRVLDVPWNDDFSAARNAVLAECRGDWIFWLDAGETLSTDDALILRDHVNHEADPRKAYMSLVRLPNETGLVSGEQVGRIRLIPADPRARFEGRIREQLRPALERAGLEVDSLAITILRSGSDHLPHVKQAKAKRDIRIADLEMQSAGALPRLLLAKAEAHNTLGDRGEARKAYRQARDAGVQGSSEMLEAFYGELTTYDGVPEAHQRQISLCVEALELFPLDAQLLCAMGSYLQAQQRIDLATRAYRTVVEYGQVNPEIWHLADIQEVVTVCLGLCLQMQQLDDEARAVLEHALEDHPAMHRCRRHLLDLHIKHMRRQEALDLVDGMLPETPHKEALRSAVRGACLAVERNWPAAKAYLQTAYHGGCRDSICFRWLIVSQIALSEYESAEKLLAEWIEREPNQVEAESYRRAIENHRAGTDGGEIPVRPPESTAEVPPFSGLVGGNIRLDPPAAGQSAPGTPHQQPTRAGFSNEPPRRA